MKFKGQMVTGDFQENTVTIEMEEPIILKAGEYMVIPIEKYKATEMLEMLKRAYASLYISDPDLRIEINELIEEATEI